MPNFTNTISFDEIPNLRYLQIHLLWMFRQGFGHVNKPIVGDFMMNMESLPLGKCTLAVCRLQVYRMSIFSFFVRIYIVEAFRGARDGIGKLIACEMSSKCQALFPK